MANTVDLIPNGTMQITLVPMTGSDVAFTFSSLLRRAQIQASAATSSIYFAAASASHAGFVLPNGQSSKPLELQGEDLQGTAVTLKGTNATNVTIIEYLRAST